MDQHLYRTCDVQLPKTNMDRHYSQESNHHTTTRHRRRKYTILLSSWDNALYELTWSQQPEQARTIHLHNSNTPIYRIEGEANKLLIGTWGRRNKKYMIKSKSVFIHYPAQNIWVPLLSMPFIKIALITSG